MSAITGIVSTYKDPGILEQGYKMMQTLQMFPADDHQTWIKEPVFLGCHAQWITPESTRDPLPFYDCERQVAITADAIIDNRDELFDLLHLNTSKKSMTDSQLILLSYYKWGEQLTKYIVGDFAFVIWDEREQKLFGARDPSGYRTLYYYLDHSQFAFCTAIKPLLTLSNMKHELNEQWLAEYLAITGFIDSLDATMTPYNRIHQVPPFHSITFKSGQVKLVKYGSFFPTKKLRLKSNSEYIEAFQDLFQKVVQSKMRTRHNIGSYLSGGLDSGAVVGFASNELKKQGKPLYTFSYVPTSDFVDFTPTSFMPDETPFIQRTVQYVRNIKSTFCDFQGFDPYTAIDEYLDMNEIPYKFFENSFWLKGIFDEAKKQNIGVLLNGEKGNFTISRGDAYQYYASLLKKLQWLRLYYELTQFRKNAGGRRFTLLPYLGRIAFPSIYRFSKHRPNHYTGLNVINPSFATSTNVYEKLRHYGLDQSGWVSSLNMNEEREFIFRDVPQWNAGSTFDSKLSLQYSLWKRDPTNDLRIVRFCLSIPEDQFVQNGYSRALIRRGTKGVLPDEVRLNQRIRGIQGTDWVQRVSPHWGQFLKEVKQMSTDERVLHYIDQKAVLSAMKSIEQGPKVDQFTNLDYRMLMRAIIVYRFMNRFT